MGINFPSSPTPGQKLTIGKTVYTFTNGSWRPAPLGTAAPFNHFINPALQISQENGVAVGNAGGFYMADGWYVANSTTVTFTARRLALATPRGGAYRLSINNTAALATIGAQTNIISRI